MSLASLASAIMAFLFATSTFAANGPCTVEKATAVALENVKKSELSGGPVGTETRLVHIEGALFFNEAPREDHRFIYSAFIGTVTGTKVYGYQVVTRECRVGENTLSVDLTVAEP